MTIAAVLAVDERQIRVVAAEARAALAAVRDLPAITAVARLRFGPGRTCEPLARMVDRALVRADEAGIGRDRLVLAGGSAQPAESIVRVRRKAHGKADWIASPTSDIRIELRPIGLHRVPAGPVAEPVAEAPASAGPRPPTDLRAVALREALYEVIDPDLGVNIVDLGFVRDVTLDGHGVATITMTLTSPACPLTGVMEDQIEALPLSEIAGGLTGVRIEWVWRPAWRPSEISAEGRDQLRAIGFSNF